MVPYRNVQNKSSKFFRPSPPSDLVDRLGLAWNGREWRGSCPACGYDKNAFILTVNRDGSLNGWCISCRDRTGIDSALGGKVADLTAPIRRRSDVAAKHRQMREFALGIWHDAAMRLAGTYAEKYFRNRCIPELVDSSALRFSMFVPRVKLVPAPAIVAAVVDIAGEFLGVHRTYITELGRKVADEPVRASLGPIWGGVIRLQEPVSGKPLIIAEGIETAASAAKLMGYPAWASISAGNLEYAMKLPEDIKDVVIAADRGEPGERAADSARQRWRKEGRKVDVKLPHPGKGDFNDILMGRKRI